MTLILGIETSCDETAAAVYDSSAKKILSNCVFSQVKLHKLFGGVVPEIAARSHLEKIQPIISDALNKANVTLDDIDVVAVTNKPGLVGSLLIGLCWAKGIAWAKEKKLVSVNHLQAHIFSAFLKDDFSVDEKILGFPHLNLSVSGGHTAFYLVEGFGKYKLIGQTLDDAAGEAFDKIAFVMGLGYPGGPIIEKLASEVGFVDFFNYPRTKFSKKEVKFSFSGLKTAIIYDLVKKGVFDLEKGVIKSALSAQLQKEVASSLLVCIGDIFENSLRLAFKQYSEVEGFSFVGGVACNQYLKKRLEAVCNELNKKFVSPACKFCADNAAMVALVGGCKAEKGEFANLELDVLD
jgi:N6-L-threonylcarbamoyladenine synthase